MPTITLGGRYRLDTRIGGGGMGEVWSAHDDVLDRTVAVKVISPHLADDEAVRERLRVEARLAGSLHHPGIVHIFDYGEGEIDGRTVPFLVMPLVDGAPLSELIKARGTLSVGETMAIVAEMATALEAAHEAGIVHRDLKPANVLLTQTGRVMLVDFGIARSLGGEALTQTGAMIGTADYLSPEQSAGRQATFASDLYALGIMAFTCLTGAPPFHRDTDVATALAQLQDPVPELPEEVLAQGAGPLLERLLAKEPTARPRSAAEVATAALALATEVPLPPRAAFPDELAPTRPGTAGSAPQPDESDAPHAVMAGGAGAALAAEAAGVPMADAAATGVLPPVTDATAETTAGSAVAEQHADRGPRRAVLVTSAVLAMAAVAFVLWFAMGSDDVTVPDIRRDTSAEATAELKQVGLTLKTREVDVAGYKAGVIVTQSPPPGENVKKGSVVKATVATGLVPIPKSILGLPYDDAVKRLNKLGFKTTPAYKVSTKESGTVITVDPSTHAKPGATIVLTVATVSYSAPPNEKGNGGKGKKKKAVATVPAPTATPSPTPTPTATATPTAAAP